jgi:hypothetical protein
LALEKVNYLLRPGGRKSLSIPFVKNHCFELLHLHSKAYCTGKSKFIKGCLMEAPKRGRG